ncbi:hypothetical protein MUO79_01485 [Candidatus Bathyarchaeota archaeon]|nr:hypothetical protein [Candidatus Bathyarchaeota archaeon]
MRNLNDILKHPSTTLVVGDTGEGKTVVAAAAMEWFNKQGIFVYMFDKQKGYPKWVHNQSSSEIEMKEKNSVLVIDDAHNYFYAGMEEDREDLKALDMINRARRHGGKRSIIYTTQQSTVLSRKLIGMTTFLIFKKSSPMQIEFERPEFQPLFIRANEALKAQPREIGYVVSTEYEGLIQIDMPKWFTDELSGAPEHYQSDRTEKNKGIFKTVTGAISSIGSVFG